LISSRLRYHGASLVFWSSGRILNASSFLQGI
jgi:hypothetical protein